MIHVDNLSKSFGSKRVSRDGSFTAEPGRVTGFVGTQTAQGSPPC